MPYLLRPALLFVAAMAAGAINAMAGGGTLISFPAAIAWGLPSTIANATNAVALSPAAFASAWAYRRELRADWALSAALIMTAGAVVGGLVGGRLARRASPRAVRAIVVTIGLGLSALLAYRGYVRRP